MSTQNFKKQLARVKSNTSLTGKEAQKSKVKTVNLNLEQQRLTSPIQNQIPTSSASYLSPLHQAMPVQQKRTNSSLSNTSGPVRQPETQRVSTQQVTGSKGVPVQPRTQLMVDCLNSLSSN